MITIPQLTAQALGSFLSRETEGRFGSSHSDLTKLLPFAARLTLECIGNSDALYHNIEHTMLVTLVGPRHPGRPRAGARHHGRRLRELHHGLPRP